MKKSTKGILVVVAGASVLGWNTLGVKYMVNSEVAPVMAYYTAAEIPAGVEITKDMLTERETPSSSIPPNAITNPEQIVGKYVKHGYGMPVNSYFYEDTLLEKDEMPNSSVLKLKKGEYAFPLLVDLETSLGNGIVPDTRVDLAFRAVLFNEETQKEEPIYGKLATDVRVTSVKDSNAGAVFNETGNVKNNGNSDQQTLSKLYTFAVSDEINELLNKAVMLGEVRPVAKGEVTEKTTLTTDEIIEWIEASSFKKTDSHKPTVAQNNQ